MHRDSTRHARSSWPPSLGSDKVDQALGLAAATGRFAADDLLSILEHIAASQPAGEVVRADEAHSVQRGTIGWQALGQ